MLRKIGTANAGFRQVEFHAPRRFHIAGAPGGDGAHLFVARREQDGGTAAVAFHAGEEQALFRLLSFSEGQWALTLMW